MLAWPGGQLLVVTVGLVVAGIGVYHVRKGLRSRFLGEIDLSSYPRPLRTLVHRWSQLGFALKGVALVLVGTVMAWAAAGFDPEQATGLDGALRAVAMGPYGAWGLTAVAVGLRLVRRVLPGQGPAPGRLTGRRPTRRRRRRCATLIIGVEREDGGMSGHGTTGRAAGAAGRAGDSDALENLARVGLVAYGVVHLLIAWLALQLAWGGGSQEQADQAGALAVLAEQPLGTPLLWVLGIGLVALAAWQLAEVLRWRGALSSSGDARKKAVGKIVKSVARAVVYAALAVTALRYATGGGSSGSSQQQQVSGVFGWPGGRWLVAIAGLVVIGVGVHHVVKGVTKKFLEQIELSRASAGTRRVVTRLGQVGYPAKGVALGVVGGLFVWAAITFDPAKASGLGGAMRTLLEAPFGQVLLTLVALGIAAFGAFVLARARYPERT
ncbi:DUF1206 domain-containing protein [Geodermatophilus marinus]|uniref:DUF1206 domain-containing protein n=1 Tax=Geodermatophilus sp. LHW52908 TaxID=2303986 RepID=UPI001313E1E9|nr:DUF1206 domain-containing protein [Geodermatophilus sp. LHW52908]